MTQILLFSDLHVHPHKKDQQRTHDCLAVLQWVFDVAKKENVEYILFGGDLLHDRSKMDIYNYHKLFETLEKNLDGSVKLYLLLGNHDLYMLEDTSVSSVTPFRSLRGVQIISQPTTIQIGESNWDCMPYTHDPISNLNIFSSEPKQDKYLIGHIAIDGARLNSKGSIATDIEVELDGDMVKVQASCFGDYKHAFFGHYHSAQQLSPTAEYIGSPLQLSFGEAHEDKHIILLDTKTNKRKYIKNTFSPKHIVFKTDSVINIDDAKESAKNNFVIIEGTDKSEKETADLMTQLTAAGAQTVGFRKKPVKTQVVVEQTMAMKIETSGESTDQLEKYVDNVVYAPLDKEKLLSIGRKLISTAMESIS